MWTALAIGIVVLGVLAVALAPADPGNPGLAEWEEPREYLETGGIGLADPGAR